MPIALNNSSKPHYRGISEILSQPTGFPDLSPASLIASNQSNKGGYLWRTETQLLKGLREPTS
jgi:hypothetical protein